ncbi:MAG: NYN domain-containing protein [Candidatus Paceibacterota bacterium]
MLGIETMNKELKNYAFIDGQNLHMGTAKREVDPWKIDLKRFRVYLADKYNVKVAFYHLGYIQDTERAQEIYEYIQSSGFILKFRQHSEALISGKKGNVDSDIIFSIMKRLYRKEDFQDVILVSGDGDYKAIVDFLIEEKRFKKILFPDKKRASSLYKRIGSEYYDNLENIKTYIARTSRKEKGS